MNSRGLFLALSTILVLGASSFVASVVFRDAIVSEFGGDLFRIWVQFVLVVVVGGLVSLAYRQLEVARQRSQSEQESLRQFHSEIVAAYNGVKKTRRLLRGRAVEGRQLNAVVLWEPYDALIDTLLDHQLNLELLKRRAEHDPNLGPDLGMLLKSMESYARRIAEEFEKRPSDLFSSPPSTAPLSRLPELMEFLGPTKAEGEYWHEFVQPFYACEDLVQRRIRDAS